MKIAVASDHGGYPYRQVVFETIRSLGHEPLDLGEDNPEPSDYPDIARRVGKAVISGDTMRGILLCGSGIGMCIAANKIRGIYAGVCHETYSAHQGVEHDNMNVLCIGARVIGTELVRDIVITFLNARYLGFDPGCERYERRFDKVKQLENEW